MTGASSAFAGQVAEAETIGPAASGPEPVAVRLTVNGVKRTLQIEPRMAPPGTLRGPLNLTGTKIACNRGACSACTVLLGGISLCSFKMLAIEVGVRSVTAAETLVQRAILKAVAGGCFHANAQCRGREP